MRSKTTVACLLVGWFGTLCGCQSMPWPNVWPFPERERTTYRTPSMRVDAIQEFAAKATGTDTPEQRELSNQLAQQIQVESDPLVRQVIVRTIAEYRTPLAQQVLEAGLADQDKAVRVACCQSLGRRADKVSVAKLASSLQSDEDVDVRLAAAEALGKIKSPESVQALAAALDDRDPALQYVGVQSMKSITGQDYGPNVEAWRQVAAGAAPPPVEPPSVAERMRGLSPF